MGVMGRRLRAIATVVAMAAGPLAAQQPEPAAAVASGAVATSSAAVADERACRQRRAQLLARDHDRPDKEYTNGDQVTIEFSAAPWWGKRFASHLAPCVGTERVGRAMPNDGAVDRPGHVHAEAEARTARNSGLAQTTGPMPPGCTRAVRRAC